MAISGRAQDASTNAPAPSAPAPSAPTATAPAVPAPTNSTPANPAPAETNAPAATYLENHPDTALPAPDTPSGFALRPGAASPPQVTPNANELFPEPIRPPNPSELAEDLAAHLLVVYNSNDPDSRSLAQYYATQRDIPPERVMAIDCPTKEEITRTEFENTIRSPIVDYLIQKDWMARAPQQMSIGGRVLDLLVATRNDIWAIVLMRGVPLKIAPDPSDVDGVEDDPALQSNAAAVDNELALLPVFGLPRGGYVPNVFFDGQVTGIKRVGPELARNMVLVTRLDGPTVADVRRMIDGCISAEKCRLAGLAVIDSRGLTNLKDGYTQGDTWLRSARDLLVADGWDVEFDDKPDVLPATDPCNEVAIYLGWYHAGAVGPWVTLPDRFVPGAIAYHLHSFSAHSVRDASTGWVAPLIAHGADATMGMVFEPYLALTPHEDIFTRRLLQGAYFAEAAYASEPALSWMLTVVGDPLYRPFRVPLDVAVARASSPHTSHDDWLLVQKVQQQLAAGQIGQDAGSIRNALDVPGAGPVAEEALGDLLSRLNQPGIALQVEQAYEKALAGDHEGIDRMRVGLKLAQYYTDHGEVARASSELDGLRTLFPEDAKRFGVADSLVPTPPRRVPARTWNTTAPFESNPPVKAP